MARERPDGERPSNWLRVTDIPEASTAAWRAGRKDLERRLEEITRTMTLEELEAWRDETESSFQRKRTGTLQELLNQRFGDLYLVDVDEEGRPIPLDTREMPEAYGPLLKMWGPTEDPHVVRVVTLRYEQYPEIYGLQWTSDFLADLVKRRK